MTAHDPRVTLTEAERRSLVEPFQRWLMDPEAVELSGVMSRSVERIIAARLAPIQAALDDPANHWWHTGGTPCIPRRVLRAALDAASAPVSAQQDHDGTEGQGERERADDGDDGFLDYILDRSCPCGPHGEVHP